MMLTLNYLKRSKRLGNDRLCRVQGQLAVFLTALVSASAFAAADGQSNSSNASPPSSERSSASTTSRAPFSAFKIITATNIFNTKRQPGVRPSERLTTVRPTQKDFFGLVGVMTYDKGPFAFFEGSGSEFQKVLKPDESIAGFKVGEIQAGAVKLISPTNELELKVGMQLTRMDGGSWQLGQRPENLDSRVTFNAQPVARREERQEETPQFPFPFPPPGAIPDAIVQGIQNALQNGGPGGQQQPVVIQTPNSQNGGNAVILAAPQNGASSEDVLQRLIRRRQEAEQGGQGNQ